MRQPSRRSASISFLVVVASIGLSTYTHGQTAAHDASGGSSTSAPAVGTRYELFDDQFRVQRLIGAPAVAPDGEAVAFGISRPLRDDPSKALYVREDRTDIWVQLRGGAPVTNVTNGASDGSGWWNPAWSPDGARLLMLSTRGGKATPWIWERASGTLRQLTTVGLDEHDDGGSCRWVDSQRVVCLALPDDDAVRIRNANCPGHELAEQAWAKARRGALSVSVVSTTEFVGATRRLMLLDVSRPGHRILARAAGEVPSGTSWRMSRETRTIVYIEPITSTYAWAQQVQQGLPGTLAIVGLDGQPLRLSAPLPGNVLTTTVALSPDETEVAFFALGEEVLNPDVLYGETRARDVVHPRVDSRDNPARLWVVNLRSGRVEEVATGDLDLGRGRMPTAFQWLASGELLFQSTRLSARTHVRSTPQPEWLILNRQGQARALTFSKGQPGSLHVLDRGRTLVGLAGEEVVRIDPANGEVRTVTADLQAPVISLNVFEGPSGAHVVVRLGKPKGLWWESASRSGLLSQYSGNAVTGTELGVLDLDTGRLTPASPPVPTATLARVSKTAGGLTTWYKADGPSGLFFWRSSAGKPAETLTALNTFRAEIQSYEKRLIDYTGANGEPLKALLILPPNFSPTRRYPVVVDSDIGYTTTNAAAAFDVDYLGNEMPLGGYDSVVAAAGYVYMFTSAPTNKMDRSIGRANLLSWHLGVLPAVDKLVEMGIADPDRVVLIGASSFGYGVYGIITQTSRFKAAVAKAGWVDQQSLSVSVTPCTRYMGEPFRGGTGPMYSSRLSSFWRDSEQFRRNSPLTYVDRVQTPLMIIHNDADFLPIQQAEMFYAALLQQRKPATFVRYWGEGHIEQGPANVRDLHQRLLAWFDRYADVRRDEAGAMVFDGNRVRSRGAAAPLPPDAFAHFPPFSASPAQAYSPSSRQD